MPPDMKQALLVAASTVTATVAARLGDGAAMAAWQLQVSCQPHVNLGLVQRRTFG